MTEFTFKNRIEGGGTQELTQWGMNSEYGVLRDVLVGSPDYYTWQDSNSVARRSLRLGLTFDNAVAREQHAEMRACYEDAGVKVHMLEPDPALIYQIYTRDSSVMTPWGGIVTQMALPSRRGEVASVVRFYHDNQIPVYDMVSAGSLEGGDFQILKPGVVLCGYSDGGRTSDEGISQVSKWFEDEGWEFHKYKFDPYFLHSDVFVVMLAENLACMCTDVVEPELVQWFKSKNIEIIDIPYKDAMNMGCNVVALGNDKVLLPKEAKILQEHCKAHGLHVYSPDISMISKGGGSLHCMCQPLRRDPVKA